MLFAGNLLANLEKTHFDWKMVSTLCMYMWTL